LGENGIYCGRCSGGKELRQLHLQLTAYGIQNMKNIWTQKYNYTI